MGLYAQLREQAWLKKLFEARRNTDLLPLARTLISLSDELTEALLATALKQPDAVEDRWRAALGKFSPKASALLSSEAQLVWTIWNALRDQGDPAVVRQVQLQRLAEKADRPLFWCSPIAPSEIELDFLTTYAQHQPVTVLGLDWSNQFLPLSLQRAWPELCETTKQSLVESSSSSTGCKKVKIVFSSCRKIALLRGACEHYLSARECSSQMKPVGSYPPRERQPCWLRG
jgi:ATP-dependent helicase/nuclease subunit B